MRNADISVVIAARNEARFLPRCLRSLRRQQDSGNFDIIVVDNGSTDATPRIAADFGCRVVEEPIPGQIRAKTRGCESTEARIIAMLDADCVAPRLWLSQIATRFDGHAPDTVALSGPYHYPKLPTWACLYQATTTYPLTRIGNLLFNNYPFVFGGNVAFVRDAFLQSGGYGHSKKWSATEIGIAQKLRQFGTVVYCDSFYVKVSPRRFYGGPKEFLKYKIRDYLGRNM